MNQIDNSYAQFLREIIQETLTNYLNSSPVMNEDALSDIILAECMDRISYDELIINVQCICTEVIDKEAVKLINILNNGRGM